MPPSGGEVISQPYPSAERKWATLYELARKNPHTTTTKYCRALADFY
jgi:hypothetical protein